MSLYHYSVDEKKLPNEQVAWLEGYCYCLQLITGETQRTKNEDQTKLLKQLREVLMNLLVFKARHVAAEKVEEVGEKE